MAVHPIFGYTNAMSVTSVPFRRDLKVMTLVGSAHAASHFFHLVLPPLFPILKSELDLSYAALGLLTTLFYASSGIAQTAAGFLVDLFGARRILLGGLGLLTLSVMAYGFATDLWMFIVLSILAGLGNSVFHPADLAILTNKVSSGRLGRAYGAHAFCGNLGWAAAPAFVIIITHYADWRTAVISAGLIGLIVIVSFLIWGSGLNQIQRDQTEETFLSKYNFDQFRTDVSMLLQPTIVCCFLYFAFLAAALIGIQSFGVAAMQALYDIDLKMATAGLTAFLIASAIGILTGGVAADRTDRHDIIAIAGVVLAALLLAVLGSQFISKILIVPTIALSGFFAGMTSPSRDMLVRKATPTGASGRIFGFVYSGLDLGSSMMPIFVGWLIDSGRPEALFYSCSLILLITITTVLKVRSHGLYRA